MRGNQVSRQWKILKVLESHKRGLSAAQISARLGVPVRTVYRDLEAIHEAGFPIYSDQIDKNSYWKFVEGFRADLPLPLTATELMSLHMSRDILRVFQGTIFQESIESLFDKVQASLPPETISYLENIAKRFRVGMGPAKDYRAFRDQIAALSDATAQKKRVQIRYRALSTGEENKRTVDPYQMWAMNGTFYLIGLCHLRGQVRTFAMDRIKDFTVLDESFDMPEDFSLEDYLQTAFRVMTGKPEVVKVWFRASAAQVVKERIWHPTQEITGTGGRERRGHAGSAHQLRGDLVDFGVWVCGRVYEPELLGNNTGGNSEHLWKSIPWRHAKSLPLWMKQSFHTVFPESTPLMPVERHHDKRRQPRKTSLELVRCPTRPSFRIDQPMRTTFSINWMCWRREEAMFGEKGKTN